MTARGFAGYPPSAAAGALAMPPFGRVAINLLANRTFGQQYPAIEGSFLYVESVDLPCRISFNGGSDEQSIGVSSGLQVNMAFKGLTLYHENYTNLSSAEQTYSLICYVGRDARAFNQFVAPQTQSPLPSNSTFGLSSGSTSFPLFPRLRFLNVFATLQATRLAGDPGYMLSYVRFIGPNNVVLQGPTPFVRPGVTYFDGGDSAQPSFVQSVPWGANVWGYTAAKINIPIPTGAVSGQLEYRWPIGISPDSVSVIAHVLAN